MTTRQMNQNPNQIFYMTWELNKISKLKSSNCLIYLIKLNELKLSYIILYSHFKFEMPAQKDLVWRRKIPNPTPNPPSSQANLLVNS